MTVTNLIGCGRFEDNVLRRLAGLQSRRIQRAFALGATVALGSDAGAFQVYHGQGLMDEYLQFRKILTEEGTSLGEEKGFEENADFKISPEELNRRLEKGEEEIKSRF